MARRLQRRASLEGLSRRPDYSNNPIYLKYQKGTFVYRGFHISVRSETDRIAGWLGGGMLCIPTIAA